MVTCKGADERGKIGRTPILLPHERTASRISTKNALFSSSGSACKSCISVNRVLAVAVAGEQTHTNPRIRPPILRRNRQLTHVLMACTSRPESNDCMALLSFSKIVAMVGNNRSVPWKKLKGSWDCCLGSIDRTRERFLLQLVAIVYKLNLTLSNTIHGC